MDIKIQHTHTHNHIYICIHIHIHMLLKVQNIIRHPHYSTSDKIYELILSKKVILPSSFIQATVDRDYFTYKISTYNRWRMYTHVLAYEFSAPQGIIYMSEIFSTYFPLYVS